MKNENKHLVYVRGKGFIATLEMPLPNTKFTKDINLAQCFLDREYIEEKLRGMYRFEIMSAGEAKTRAKKQQFKLSKETRIRERIRKKIKETAEFYNIKNDMVIKNLTEEIVRITRETKSA